jgi:hypothetical protein
MRLILLASIAAALAAPAIAQENDTLKNVIAKGSVVKANMQGQDLELQMAYKPDGTYSISVMGQSINGKWRIDGDKLCTSNDTAPNESCTPYPAGKKPGDEFKVTSPTLGEVTVKINP